MRRITSRHNPIVARFRAVGRGEEPGLILDGQHLVEEALRSSVTVRDVMVTTDGLERREIQALVERLERGGAAMVSVPRTVMSAVSTLRSTSAIVAIADRPRGADGRLYVGTPLVIVACDVQDPGNVGAIVRVAEAAGGSGVVAAGSSADPYGVKALRGSMGSALRLPVASGDAAAAVDEAERHGCRILATVPEGGRSVFDVDLTGPTAFLIGGEGGGLPLQLLDKAHEQVTVPMQAAVESLNAALTAAVVLYEAYRQRYGKSAIKN
jgi:TrmH family RNA methyltransferase